MAIALSLGMSPSDAFELAEQVHIYGDVTHTLFMCTVGPGPFKFGSINFKAYGDLADEVKETARVGNLPGGFCRGFSGVQSLALHFPAAAQYKEFIEVANYPASRGAEDLRIQVSGKSVAWHSFANRHILFSNQSLGHTIEPARQQYVSGTCGRLVDYVFSDFSQLREFWTCIDNKTFDAEVARTDISWGPKQ